MAKKQGLRVFNRAKRTKLGKKAHELSKSEAGKFVIAQHATAAPAWAWGKVQQHRARKQAEREEQKRILLEDQ